MIELDQGAKAIGALRAEMKESRRQRAALAAKLDEVAAQVAAMSAQMALVLPHLKDIAELAARLPPLEAELAAMKPLVDSYRDERVGRTYLLWFVGVACTALGAVAPAAGEALRAYLGEG